MHEGLDVPSGHGSTASDLMHEGLDVLRCSDVIFDVRRRQREIAAVRLTVAKNDPGFQDLLSKATAGGDDLGEVTVPDHPARSVARLDSSRCQIGCTSPLRRGFSFPRPRMTL
jgi:hypothetical protein